MKNNNYTIKIKISDRMKQESSVQEIISKYKIFITNVRIEPHPKEMPDYWDFGLYILDIEAPEKIYKHILKDVRKLKNIGIELW